MDQIKPALVLTVVLSIIPSIAMAGSSCEQRVCQEIRALKDLPREVLSFILNHPQTPLADRGGKFNVTDVVDESLPMRRFVVAGMTRNRLAIEIECGGRSHYFQALQFRRVNNQWIYTSTENSRKEIDDLSTFLQ